MQTTAKDTHPLGSPRTSVPSSAKSKAKFKGKTMDGLIDPDCAVAARVVAGRDGSKAKAKKAPAKSKAPAKKAKAAKPKKIAKKCKPATPSRPGLRDPFPGSLMAKMILLLQRPNGATITEILRTRPKIKGATPAATISAEAPRIVVSSRGSV